MSRFKVTSGPTAEAITLLEAKSWLKIHPDVVEDDNLIRSLIASARVWAERNMGIALLTQTVQEGWDYWPSWEPMYYGQMMFELSLGPLSGSTVTFEYRDSTGAYNTWASTNYTVDDISTPARIVVNRTSTLPFVPPTNIYPNTVRITYTVGKSTPDLVDANIKTAMLLQIAMMYENREDIPISKGSALPFARSAYSLLALSRISLI